MIMSKKQTIFIWLTSPIFIFFCLIGITWLGYFNSLNSPFIFDDYPFILKNEIIVNIDQILQKLTRFYIPGRSLVFLTYHFNHQFHQYEVPGYHVVNIFMHGINGFLVFTLIKMLFLDIYQRVGEELTLQRLRTIKIAAFGAAGIFVAHPLLVSAVTYLTQRSSLMLTGFFILGLMSFLKMRNTSFRSPLFWIWGGVTLLFYIASFKSKEMAIIWLALPITYEFIVRISDKKRIIAFLKWALPVTFIGIAIFASIIIIYFDGFSYNFSIKYNGQTLWGPWTHLQTMFRSLMHYWKLLFFPLPEWRNINHVFPVSQTFIDPWSIAALAFHLGLLGLAWFLAMKRQILAAFGIIWFYIGLSPYIIVPARDLLVEYKTYLSSVGWTLIIANLIFWIQEKYKVYWYLNTVIIGIVILGTVGTWQRNSTYQNKLSIWKDAISKDPNNAKSLHNVGFAYVTEHNDFERAKYYYQKSLKADPGFVLSRVSLAKVYVIQKNYKQAMIEYEKFFDITSRYPTPELKGMIVGALSDAAIVSVEMKKYEQAMQYFQRAFSINPNFPKTRFGLGKVYMELNKLKEARIHLEWVQKVSPNNPEVYLFLGIINVKESKIDEAIPLFQRGLKIAPRNPDLWNNLGVSYIIRQEFVEAEKAFQAVLKLVPNHKQATGNLKYVQRKLANPDTPDPNINTNVNIFN